MIRLVSNRNPFSLGICYQKLFFYQICTPAAVFTQHPYWFTSLDADEMEKRIMNLLIQDQLQEICIFSVTGLGSLLFFFVDFFFFSCTPLSSALLHLFVVAGNLYNNFSCRLRKQRNLSGKILGSSSTKKRLGGGGSNLKNLLTTTLQGNVHYQISIFELIITAER